MGMAEVCDEELLSCKLYKILDEGDISGYTRPTLLNHGRPVGISRLGCGGNGGCFLWFLVLAFCHPFLVSFADGRSIGA